MKSFGVVFVVGWWHSKTFFLFLVIFDISNLYLNGYVFDAKIVFSLCLLKRGPYFYFYFKHSYWITNPATAITAACFYINFPLCSWKRLSISTIFNNEKFMMLVVKENSVFSADVFQPRFQSALSFVIHFQFISKIWRKIMNETEEDWKALW